MKKRGYSFEKCLDVFNKRQEDYQAFISPQMEHADIVIRYSTPTPIPEVFDAEPYPIQLECICEVSNDILPCVQTFLTHVSSHVSTASKRTTFQLHSGIDSSQLIEFVDTSYHSYIRQTTLRDSFQGILQLLFIQLMIQPDSQSSV
jgi:hypothetical protein